MKKASEPDPLAERPNLDFSKGVRGKHAAQFREGCVLVMLEPDLYAQFPDSESVNRVLRAAVAAGLDKQAASGR